MCIRDSPDLVPDECQANADCDDDGMSDACELEIGTQIDVDFNGIPDECQEAPCDGDADGNGAIDFNDLVTMLSLWGPCDGCASDIDGNGQVEFNDLVALLSQWGSCG